MNKRVMAVCGYGPGISQAVAQRFGQEGFELALIARTESRLQKAVQDYQAAGVKAHAFAGDLSDSAGTRLLLEQIGAQVAPVTVYFYNALAMIGTDVLQASVPQLQNCFSVGIISLLAGLQPCVRQMQGQQGAAVLITGGGFAQDTDEMNDEAVRADALGLATVKAAQHKLAQILSRKLAPEGIYVGEVMVLLGVTGTPFDDGINSIPAETVAEAFWKLYCERDVVTVKLPRSPQ